MKVEDGNNSVQQIKIDRYTNIYINGAAPKDIKTILKHEQTSSRNSRSKSDYSAKAKSNNSGSSSRKRGERSIHF